MLSRQKKDIVKYLECLEAETGYHILMAVAGGVRAWGVPAIHNDVDILCVFSGSSVLEDIDLQTIDDLQSASMTKIFKAGEVWATVFGHNVTAFAGMCTESSYIPVDLIQSPCVFMERPGFRDAIVELVARRSPASMAQAYADHLSVLQRRIVSPQTEKHVSDYLEAVRLALSVYWLEDDPEGLPPLDLQTLISEVDLPDDDVADAVLHAIELCVLRQPGNEQRRIPILDRFLLRAVQETAQIAPMLRHAILRPRDVCQVIADAWPSVAPVPIHRMAAAG